jgi:hypothetical protein
VPTAKAASRVLANAVIAALAANTDLTALLASGASFYSVRAPQGSASPYVTISGWAEEEANLRFEGGVNQCTLDLHIFSPTEPPADGTSALVGADRLLAIWEQIQVTLHRVILVVASQEHWRGTTRLVTVLLDPSGEKLHGLITYEATLVPAS